MGTISQKLEYLDTTRELIRTNINALGNDITEEDTFRSYANVLDEMWESQEQVSGTGTSLTLNTKKGKAKVDLLGNTSQEGTPTPETPQDIHIVSGDNTIVSTGKNLIQGNTKHSMASQSNGQINIYDTGTSINNYLGFSQKTKVEPNTTYTIKFYDISVNKTFYYTTYKKDGTYIDRQSTTNSAGVSTFTTGDDVYYIFGWLYDGNGYFTTIDTPIQLEKGTQATTYEPYQGTDYQVNLGVENLFTNSIYNDLDVSGNAQLQDNGYYQVKFNSNKTLMEGQFKANTQYTISCMAYGSASGNNGVIGFNYTDNTNEVKGINQTTPYQYTITSSAGKTIKNIKITYGSQNTTYIKDLQLEKGTKANSYTPYGTTPIELCKIGTYQDRFIRNSGKNLFDENYYNDTTLYTQQTPYFCSLKMPDSFKTKFYGNMTLKGASQNLVFGFSTSSNSVSTRMLSGGTITNNVEYDFTNATDVYLLIGNSSNINITTDIPKIFNNYNIMVSKTSGETYEPYGSNEWYLEKKIGKVVLDGSENWTYVNSSFRHSMTNLNTTGNDVIKQVANYFQAITYSSSWSSYDYFVCYTLDGNVVLKNKDITGINDFKTWLSTHNTIVYYVLSSPTYTKIEGTLKEELEQVWRANTYEGQTNIGQVNNDLPFELIVKGLAVESEGE